MASSYFELRKKQGNVTESLQQKFKNAAGESQRRTNDIEIVDDTFWTTNHVRGKDGTGYAIIRFLPEAPNPECEGGVEPTPFVKYTEFFFQGPTGKKYWNLSPTSMGGDYKDPAQEYNWAVWRDESLTKDQKKAKYLRKSDHYVSNILVIKDPNKPENEGKVFRFKYGYGIFKFTEEAMFPDTNLYPDRSPVPVFDMVEGANFVLRVISKQVPQPDGSKKSLPSYEKSSFEEPSPLFGEDESKYEATWKKLYTLQDYLKPERFKTYDKLLEEFVNVMGQTPDGVKPMSTSYEAQQVNANRSYQMPDTNNSTLSDDLNDDIPDFGSAKSEPTGSDGFDFNDLSTSSKTEESPFKETSSSSADDDLGWLNSLKS